MTNKQCSTQEILQVVLMSDDTLSMFDCRPVNKLQLLPHVIKKTSGMSSVTPTA